MSKPQGTTTYCYTPDEVQAIIGSCNRVPALHGLRDVITTLATTGLRISELANLRWDDLSSDQSMLELTDESVRGSESHRTTKNARSRTFPINAALQVVLERLPKRRREIFRGPRGRKLKPDTVLRILRRDVLKPLAEQSPERVTERITEGGVHSFRHYFCSISASRGVPERVVMRWLGHSDSKMIQRYCHLPDNEAKRQMSRLDFLGNGESDEGSAGDDN